MCKHIFVDDILDVRYDEKKAGVIVASSDAMKRAIKKYDQEKVDRIIFRVPKGKKSILQAHAEKQGESVNAFINRAVTETMERDEEKANTNHGNVGI